MIITISGTPGSGKSTIAKTIVKDLNAEYIYVGGIRRELAKNKGMTLEELNVYAQTHPETDVDIDKEVAKTAREKERDGSKGGKIVLVEGRTQYHFLPESLKIFIKVSISEAAKRIWKDLQNKETKQQRNEGEVKSLEDMEKHIISRQKEDLNRYQKYYKINPEDESQYDFVLDTSKMNAEEASRKVLSFIKDNLN
ncbi:cytidylate kinase family protein [Candidatus Woesearchaeota archaeon]|nr:cytidylate kinase family protein [Candidatus Woesearchaeota archaeon]